MNANPGGRCVKHGTPLTRSSPAHPWACTHCHTEREPD